MVKTWRANSAGAKPPSTDESEAELAAVKMRSVFGFINREMPRGRLKESDIAGVRLAETPFWLATNCAVYPRINECGSWNTGLIRMPVSTYVAGGESVACFSARWLPSTEASECVPDYQVRGCLALSGQLCRSLKAWVVVFSSKSNKSVYALEMIFDLWHQVEFTQIQGVIGARISLLCRRCRPGRGCAIPIPYREKPPDLMPTMA